jgi:hypothetical protein
MKSLTPLSLVSAALLLAAGCSVDVAGAPCATDDNCPVGQVCVAGTCEFGSGSGAHDAGRPPTGDGGPADRGTATDVPTDATTDAEVADTGQVGDSGGDWVADSGGDVGGQSDGSDMSDVSDVPDASLPDGGADAASDAGGDAGTDAGGDAGSDAGGDAGVDAGFFCISDKDCGGAHCCKGVCAPTERGCCDQEDCIGAGEGIICADMICQCKDDWDCPGSERICDLSAVPPDCVDGCTPAKCGPGNVCCGKDCFAGECCADKDCAVPGKPTCRLTTHTCTNACKPGGTPCGAEYVCCVDTCKRGNCCTDGDCVQNPDGPYCVSNACAKKCTTDGNCPGGKCCTAGPFSGTCYFGECCADSQCTAPETCGGGGVQDKCGCTPEPKTDFCRRMNAVCGNVTGKDNCGVTRTEDCGTCQGCASICDSGECHPIPHANVACDGGDVWWFDSCWARETVKDDCEGGEICAGAACCLPETDEAFCARLGKNCNDVTAEDNCGIPRTADCGDCDPGWTCGLHEANVCGCDDDGHACDGRRCGTAKNNCGVTIGCGMCPMNQDCCDGQCVNLQTDRKNCVTCGIACEWDEVCLSGCQPQAWELLGGGVVNPGVNALGHALGTDGSTPYVAWTASEPGGDGGVSVRNSVLVHQLSGGTWKQVGLVLSDPFKTPRGPVDIQFKGGSPLVLFVESNGNFHVMVFNGAVWTEVGAPGYNGPCLIVDAVSLALESSGVPHLTSIGMGGCGAGVGYSYFNANLMTWWQTPQPPAPMPGLITMNGAGVTDVVHDGTRALVALADRVDMQTGVPEIFVKWWNSMPPGAWTDIGDKLNSNPLPPMSSVDFGLLSMTLTPEKQPLVAFVEVENSVQVVKVKAFDPNSGAWILLGGGKASGLGDTDSPSVAFVDGVPHVAYVEADPGGAQLVQVRRFVNDAWERVGAPLNAPAADVVAPYLVGVGKVPHVAYRINDEQDRGWIHVVRFVAPLP